MEMRHNKIRDGSAGVISRVMASAGIISQGVDPAIEPKKVIDNVDNCRPFDFSMRPEINLEIDHVAPCPFDEIGFDVTISRSKCHAPPSQRDAFNSQSAIAVDKHLREKERAKLKRQGMVDNDGQDRTLTRQ